MTTRVKVAYVNQPKKADGKYGNIKDADGNYYQVPVNMLRMFEAGTTYDITVKRQTWGKGTSDEREVQIVDKIDYTSKSEPAQQSRSTSGNTGGFAAAKTPTQALDIFVTGIVGRAMGSGKFGPSDVADWTDAAIKAWFAGQVLSAKLFEDLTNDGEGGDEG